MTPTDAAETLILILGLQNDNAALRRELELVRAAESGDAAPFEGSGWTSHGVKCWYHAAARVVVKCFGTQYVIYRDADGWWASKPDEPIVYYNLAIDAMRVAVPGSV